MYLERCASSGRWSRKGRDCRTEREDPGYIGMITMGKSQLGQPTNDDIVPLENIWSGFGVDGLFLLEPPDGSIGFWGSLQHDTDVPFFVAILNRMDGHAQLFLRDRDASSFTKSVRTGKLHSSDGTHHLGSTPHQRRGHRSPKLYRLPSSLFH